ncbi:MAG: DnaA/Hda family protein, partial [Planctomycetaceae bacterium]
MSRFQQTLIARLGARRYANWFEKTTRLEVNDNELIVLASSPYLQKWLQRQFADVLRTVATELIGPGATIRFDVAVSEADGPVSSQTTANSQDSQTPPPPPPQEPTRSRRDAVPRTAASRRRFADLTGFIPGSRNVLAFTAGLQGAAGPGGPLKPLCLYGSVGCGKTHLLEGIYRQIRREFPALQVLFLTAENFANYFTQALRERNLPSFHQKFRSVDVLLVDDVDFLNGKSGIEEEFLHTLKSLESLGRQVVLTADRHPRLLDKSSDELVTRMLSGLACRLESSDFDTRLEIVRQRVRRNKFPVADDALEFIAR